MQWLLALAAGALVFLALYAGLKGRKQVWALIFGPVVRERVEFGSLSLRDTPNQFLVCPPGLCRSATAHMDAPVFNLTPPRLRELWMQRIGGLPLVEEIAADPANEQYDFEALTPRAHFPDTVTVRFLPVGAAQSTLAIYSRSHYGKSDLGANEKRIKGWLTLLSRQE